MEKISVLKKKWLLREIEKLTTKGVSKADIARDLDVKPQYLNSILNADRGITDQFLDKFIECYGINQFDLYKAINDNNTDKEVESSGKNKPIEGFMKELLREKDDRIQELSKEVGRLEGKNDELKKLILSQEQGARDAGCAAVG